MNEVNNVRKVTGYHISKHCYRCEFHSTPWGLSGEHNCCVTTATAILQALSAHQSTQLGVRGTKPVPGAMLEPRTVAMNKRTVLLKEEHKTQRG